MGTNLNRAVLLLLLTTVVHGHVADSCAGAQRAPLRISPPFRPELNALRMVYAKEQNFTVRNAGNRLALEAASRNDLGFVDYRGKRYTAELADFRSPAEHVLGTTRPPVELQMYHHDEDGKTLAISLLFKIGNSRSLLIDKVLRGLDRRRSKGGASPVALLDFAHLFKHSSDYFAYSTVGCGPEPWGHPPMDRWIVLSKMKQISALQLKQLRRRVPELSRTTRSLNPRQTTTEVVSTKAGRQNSKHISAQQRAAEVLPAPAARREEYLPQPFVNPPKVEPIVPNQKVELPKVVTEVSQLQKLPAQKELVAQSPAVSENELPWIPTDLPALRESPPSVNSKSVAALATAKPVPQVALPSLVQESQLPTVPSQVPNLSAQHLKTPEELMAMLRVQPATMSASKVQKFSPEELNMVNAMEGAPDDMKVVPTTMPTMQVGKASKRPAAGLLQSGSGATDNTATFQDPIFADPETQATMGVTPTYIPPPPFYNELPTASPEGLSGSYSRPQASLVLTDADLAAEYKQGFNQYVAKEAPKDRMVSMYKTNQQLPPLDALVNPTGPLDVMPNLPMEPPALPMGDGMGGILPPISGGFSLIQRQKNGGDSVEEKLKKNDEALKKHFGNLKPSSSSRPTLTLLQGAGAGQGELAGSSADLLMQQAQYKDWFQQNAMYQKQYGSNFKTGDDVASAMQNRMDILANMQQQQKAMNDEILDAMHSTSPHRGKKASMIRVNSTVNSVERQKYLAQAAAREEAMWDEYHHLEGVQKELEQAQKHYEQVNAKTQEEMQLYSARTRQTSTLWHNYATQRAGPAGFFLAPR